MDIKRDHYDGTKLVTIVSYGQIYTHLANSDGVQVPTGLALAGDIKSSVEIVYVGNGRFLIVTASGNSSLN